MAHVEQATEYSLIWVPASGIIGSSGMTSPALLGVVETSGAHSIPFCPPP